jgi:hypothetical protein
MASANESPERNRKRKYEQKFKSEYVDEFKCVERSKASETSAFCTLCRTDITIAHGGRDDIRKHIGSQKHKSAVLAAKSQPTVSGFFQRDKSLDVTRSELLFTSFLVEFC